MYVEPSLKTVVRHSAEIEWMAHPKKGSIAIQNQFLFTVCKEQGVLSPSHFQNQCYYTTSFMRYGPTELMIFGRCLPSFFDRKVQKVRSDAKAGHIAAGVVPLYIGEGEG